MCDKCKKLWELYAQTQLECTKNNCVITKIQFTTCPHCFEYIYIALEVSKLVNAPINIDGLNIKTIKGEDKNDII